MFRNKSELLELDIDKLFEDRSIDEIIEIEKILDAEIEKKRNELRSMVGDRYKDVLAASDTIISMKTISQEIVDSIEKITTICEELIASPVVIDSEGYSEIDRAQIEERTLVVQIRLAIFMNEHIWIALDEDNNLDAAQYYLLAQHIHTGLSLSKKEYLDRIPLLHQIKHNLVVLRSKIFQNITEKLESVEITAQETSHNLNALMLLESCKNLLSIFIEHRKTALNTVINTSYSSVRLQISAMVRCLITTIHLLHDCFICTENEKRGIIWQQLHNIINDSSPTTLSKLTLPITPLVLYIPEIIKQFRPKPLSSDNIETSLKDAKMVIESWLQSTQDTVKDGLEKSLRLVTNVKGLHLIREESFKIELPKNWEQICVESHLPEQFDVWYYFFQSLITNRCRSLISNKISTNIQEIQTYIANTLNTAVKSDRLESDLRWYIWTEEHDDVSKIENIHKGLSMKTKGYSQSIVDLCEEMDRKYLELLEDVSQYLYGLSMKTKGYSQSIVDLCEEMDRKYLELLEDVSQYLYGRDYSSDINFSVILKDYKFKRKYIDKDELEIHLKVECTKNSMQITHFIEEILNKDAHELVTKSIICARFFQAIPVLCTNFNKCCTFNHLSDDWLKICDMFNRTSHTLWQTWVNDSVEQMQNETGESLDISLSTMIKILSRWDEIEIQEQTEEKVFKSQIKVPLKPSLVLNNILLKLNNNLSYVLPHTLPKQIHLQFIEKNVIVILNMYKQVLSNELNQIQALQFLFDVKYLTTLCIPRENVQLVSCSQEICDKLRSRIDPFDLDVFYSYLQNNVKKAVFQSQMILGCLLPSSTQLASLGVSEKTKEQEKIPSILALSTPSTSSWFPLLPITAPSQKTTGISSLKKITKDSSIKATAKTVPKKSQDPGSVMRQGAASLFGGLTTDWFS